MKTIMNIITILLLIFSFNASLSANYKIYFVFPADLNKSNLEYAAKIARKIQNSTNKSGDSIELLAFNDYKSIKEKTNIFQKIISDNTVYMPIVCICYSGRALTLIKSIDRMINEHNKINYKSHAIDKIINLHFKDKLTKKNKNRGYDINENKNKIYNINVKINNSKRCSCLCGDKALERGSSVVESTVALINNLLDTSKFI